MRSLEDRKLLLDVIAGRDTPLLSFPLSDCSHARKHDGRNSAPNATRGFSLARILLIEKLFDSLTRTRVDAEVRRGRPVSPADHIRHVSTQHLSAKRSGIERLLRRLILRGM